MIYIVPSRGRPHVIPEFIQTFGEHRTVSDLLFVVDNDDPQRDEYRKHLKGAPDWCRWILYMGEGGTGMVGALNEGAKFVADKHDVLGFMGDDHRPRTLGWDALLEAPARAGRIAYGDDLLQRQNLPTAVVMPARYVRALGFMSPPIFNHLYVDNYWAALGAQVGIEYVPQAVVEHMHPVAGKAEWDAEYKRVNDGQTYHNDANAWHRYVGESLLEADVQKCLAVR